MKHLRHIVMLTQFGLSIILPLLMFILLARYLMVHYAFGSWVMLLGVLFGICGAVSGLVNGLRQMQKEADRDKKDSPISFNDHA